MKAILGLDTSCYTTSVAAVTPAGELIAAHRRLLEVEAGARGLQQSQGVFQHAVWLPRLVEQLGEEMKAVDWCAICASTRPRPASSSYMPVFQVGEGYARAAASLLRVPFYAQTHQQGHVRAALVGTGWKMDAPLLAFHLSGGTTELLDVTDGACKCIGATQDLHAGQLVDRVGVALGLHFPAGPALEALAIFGQEKARIPVSMTGGDCHFSGAEAQAMRWIDGGTLTPADIAAEVFSFLTRTIQRMICAGVSQTGTRRVLLAGGVASSALLRTQLTQRMASRARGITLAFARPELSGDNAVGIALLGAEAYQQANEEAVCP